LTLSSTTLKEKNTSQQAAVQEQETREDLKVEIRRVIKAPRSRVFASWTTPELMQQWFAPGGMRVASASTDLRVGGEYRVEMHGADDAVYVAAGVYRKIVPNELLSFSWIGACAAGEETLVTVRLRDFEQGTELILTHEHFGSAETAAKHEHGWTGCLDKLEEFSRQAS
jgi:uncharacterized protein YndB with AHSA1/START domain